MAMRYTVPRPKVLVVGYPSNPTAYVADLAFYERLVAFAREHELIVISDLAYAEIYFGDTPTPSILQVEGAKDVAVEFTSMSKTYSMAGWRIGFAVGNARLIEALARVKSYLDYGAFTPVQAAAVAALNGPQDIVEANRALYKKRRDVLVESFGRAGWDIPVPQASMFAWAPIPERFRELGSMEFAKTPADRSPCRGRARRRLRRGRRRLRPHRAGRERAAPAPGRARREEDARRLRALVGVEQWSLPDGQPSNGAPRRLTATSRFISLAQASRSSLSIWMATSISSSDDAVTRKLLGARDHPRAMDAVFDVKLAEDARHVRPPSVARISAIHLKSRRASS